MLTKDQFIDLMTELIELSAKWEKFEDAFSPVNETHNPMFVTHQDIALRAIRLAMDDTEDFISWWIYDCSESGKHKWNTRPKAVIVVDGLNVNLTTLGKLYDYLAKK